MKLNLLINNPGDVRSGYVNVDPAAQPGELDRVACDLTNLDPVADDAEVTELLAYDVFDQFPAGGAARLLDHWVKKLAHGGTIALSGVDLLELSKAFALRQLTVDEANGWLHGEKGERRATYTLQDLVDVLEQRGLRIIKKRSQGRRYIVVAQRP